MRKPLYRMNRDEALGLLRRAPAVHLASTAPDGTPILRTLHGVVVDGSLAFHGAPAGEKLEALGRPAVVSAEEIIAEVPSYFFDPEKACPATTYYRSVQVHGVLEAVEEPVAKARVLQALMERFQSEGGYVPIDASHPLYASAVESILIVRIGLDRVSGKAKLGQNRPPEQRVRALEQMWRRGLPGDPRAIQTIRDAFPDLPAPAFLEGPPGTRLVCAPSDEAAEEAASLLAGEYWNEAHTADTLRRAHLGSSAWVAARESSGAMVGSGRALADGAKIAWVYDLVVAPAWRRRGLGRALLGLLLDHPAVRGSRRVFLHTRDGQPLYERFGFAEVEGGGLSPFPLMRLLRAKS